MRSSIITLFIMLTILLVGCDKGSSPLAKAETEYDALVKKGLALSDEDAIGAIYVNAGIIAKTNPDKDSAKKAEKLRERVRNDVMAMIQREKPAMDELGTKFVDSMKAAETETIKFDKEIAKGKRLSAKEKFSEGECVFFRSPNKTSTLPILFEVRADRVEKADGAAGGKIFVKPYFVAKRGAFAADFKKSLQDDPGQEQDPALMAGGIKVKCEKLEPMREKYQIASAFGSEFDPKIRSIQSLAGMLNSAAH